MSNTNLRSHPGCGGFAKAVKMLNSQGYASTLDTSRTLLEEVLRTVLFHFPGVNKGFEDGFVKNCIDYFRTGKRLGDDDEFYNKLHQVRIICNRNAHSIVYANSVEHGHVYFVVKTIEELIIKAEVVLDIR